MIRPCVRGWRASFAARNAGGLGRVRVRGAPQLPGVELFGKARAPARAVISQKARSSQPAEATRAATLRARQRIRAPRPERHATLRAFPRQPSRLARLAPSLVVPRRLRGDVLGVVDLPLAVVLRPARLAPGVEPVRQLRVRPEGLCWKHLLARHAVTGLAHGRAYRQQPHRSAKRRSVFLAGSHSGDPRSSGRKTDAGGTKLAGEPLR